MIAVDPLANKREAAEDLGATHSAATAEEAHELAQELTRGVGADKAISPSTSSRGGRREAFDAVRKGGTVVITGLADPTRSPSSSPARVLTLYEKRSRARCSARATRCTTSRTDRPLPAGKLKLDELITKTYTLDEVNQGFRDMLDGKNIRGVVIHEH